LRGCCQARRLGRSIRKYLRRNLPSRERSGPPQQMHATSPSAVGPGVASKPTTSYFAEANGAMEQSCESFRHAQSSLRSGEYSLRKRSKFLAVPLDGTLRHDPEPTSDRPAIGGKSKGVINRGTGAFRRSLLVIDDVKSYSSGVKYDANRVAANASFNVFVTVHKRH